jgi:hypothetical protein
VNEIDNAILAAVSERWQKVAMIIAKVRGEHELVASRIGATQVINQKPYYAAQSL